MNEIEKEVLERFIQQAEELKLMPIYKEMPWQLRDQFNEDLGRCKEKLNLYNDDEENVSNLSKTSQDDE